MPRHAEYSYRQKKVTAQSPAQCLQSLMPFPWLSLKLICKIVSHSVGITHASCKHTPLFLSETSPGVAEVTFVEKEPAERHTIVSWEQVSVFLIKLPLGQFECAAAHGECQMQWQPCVYETACYQVWCTVQPKQALLVFFRYHSSRLSHAPDLLEKHHQCGYIQHDSSKKKPHNCSRQLQWWLSVEQTFLWLRSENIFQLSFKQNEAVLYYPWPLKVKISNRQITLSYPVCSSYLFLFSLSHSLQFLISLFSPLLRLPNPIFWSGHVPLPVLENYEGHVLPSLCIIWP